MLWVRSPASKIGTCSWQRHALRGLPEARHGITLSYCGGVAQCLTQA